ncbi:hypothetical protein EB835_02865 [Brevibacterium sp. S22]|nr:hypothetical protein EB835_02865 [Brevibacterium sp. S22]
MPAGARGDPGWMIRDTELRPHITELNAFRQVFQLDPLAEAMSTLAFGFILPSPMQCRHFLPPVTNLSTQIEVRKTFTYEVFLDRVESDSIVSSICPGHRKRSLYRRRYRPSGIGGFRLRYCA